MKDGHIDLESRSVVDLKKTGVHVYAADASTDVLLAAIAVDDDAPILWTRGDPCPELILRAVAEGWTLHAFNAQFERVMWEKILTARYGWPQCPGASHWRCTQAQALACALPGELDRCARALSLPLQKDAEGKRLMLSMCKPRKARKGEPPGLYWIEVPEDLARLGRYCQRDVEVERALYRKLPPLSDAEQALWTLDATINARGFHTDKDLLDAAARIAVVANQAMQDEIARLTDGVVTSTNQRDALKAWLAGRGCDLADMKKTTLAAARRRKKLDPAARRAIDLRRGAAADPKVHTMLAHRSADGRIRGTLRYHGAGTGRFSAIGVQVQNYMRDHGGIDDVIDAILAGDMSPFPWPLAAIAYAARGAVVAAPGHRLMIGDFSGVESRVLAWVAGETTKLAQWIKFDQTGDQALDPYSILAEALGLGADGRQTGKTVDLAFGFQGGPGAYAQMAPEGDTSTEEDREGFKLTWRRRHPQTVAFWKAVDRAAVAAVQAPGSSWRVGDKGLRFDGNSKSLKLTLPSGRIVRYPFPTIMRNRFDQNAVTFMDTAFGRWAPCNHGKGAYGGMFTENIVQAIARDLLAQSMLRLEAADYRVVLTVHDEIVCEVPDGVGDLDEFKRLLVISPAWADGLPIAAKCRESPRYSKPGGTVPAVLCAADPPPDDDDLEAVDEPDTSVDDEISTPVATVAEAPPWVETDGAEVSEDVAAGGPPESPYEAVAATEGRVVLVDGTNIARRAYEAVPGDAVAVFERMLRKLLRGLPARTHFAVVFDVPGPTFRHAIYPAYKAHRPPVPADLVSQLPAMHAAARAFGMRCVEHPGVEADDVIATLARQARERDAATTIISSDKDLMQLVTDKATLYDPANDRRVGIAEVIKKFGVPPHQVVDVLALMGDSADNVPGVPGIGIKTAAQLIRAYGDLETLLAQAGEVDPPKWRQVLIDNAGLARLSLRLVQLDDKVELDVSLEDLAVHAGGDALGGDVAAEGSPVPPGAADIPEGMAGFTLGPAPPPPSFEEIMAALDAHPVADPDVDNAQQSPDEAPKPNGKGNGADADQDDVYTGDSDGPAGNGHGERDTGRTVAFYIYKHADGSPYLGVKRTSTKQFPQFHWTGAKWEKGAPQGVRIPYRLPELIKAARDRWVLICAGEKDANSAAALGFIATCNPEGEKKGAWVPELNAWFAGRPRVAIMEDNDKTGQAHVIEVANALRGIGIPDIRIVSFRELPEHGDLTDWIEQGHGAKDLRARVEQAKIERPTLKTWDVGGLLGTGLPPPRAWLYGRQLCRRFLSSLVAPGDAGKTTLRLTQAIELASGRELLGHRIYQRCRVLIVSLEDDHDELWRRLLAACRHHGVDRDELAGQLFCSTVNGPKLVERGVNGVIQLGALDGMLRESIEERRPDLLGLDPFVKLHALVENDNADMDFLCGQLTRLAHDYDMAVDSPAHTHKGALEAGNSDNRRGASAQRDASRLDYTLARMTDEEAKRFGIDLDARRDYVRLDRAKANIVRGSIKSTWLRMVNVRLGNATEDYPEGDEVQAIESWVPPETWAGITDEMIDAMLTDITEGMPNGQRYSDANAAKTRMAWQVVQRHCPTHNEAQCHAIIKAWVKSGVLYSDDYDDPIEHKSRKGLFVNAAARSRASEGLRN
jgi:DNA polymerase bacteriophage-type